ncbi:MAG: hypothetical protein LBC88_05005 [Spirochaetaceae bacterium]|jgi:hypothetical protein|nr:hypothetical protein [Spirochaetaceae bacterium]
MKSPPRRGNARHGAAHTRAAIAGIFALLFALASCASTEAAPEEGLSAAPGSVNAPAADDTAVEGKWTRVQSPSGLVGDWSGHVDVIIPHNDQTNLPKSSIRIVITLRHAPPAPRMSMIMRVDMEQIITDYANSEIMKSRGVTAASLWEMMEEQFRSQMGLETGRYTLSADLSDTPENVLAPRSGIVFYLDSSRTSLRMVFNQPIVFNLGDRGFSELTLYRTTGGVL